MPVAFSLSLYTHSCIHIHLLCTLELLLDTLSMPAILFFQGAGGSRDLSAGEFPLVKIFPLKWRPKTVRKQFYVPPKLTMAKHRLAKDKRNSQQQVLHFSKVGFSDKPLAIEYQWIADFTFRVCFALTSHLTCDIL